MRISIAMTTYQGERFVHKQLTSLLRQRRPADEVVIVDDCSSDHTIEIIEAFRAAHDPQTKHWQVLRNEKRLGFKANFYRAFSLTTGDLIAPCDQDDIWYEGKLERMEAAFRENPAIRSLGCAFDRIDETDAVERRGENLLPFDTQPGALIPLPDFGASPLFWIGSNYLSGCMMMVERQTLDFYLACSRKEIAHDWELNLIAALDGGVYLLNEPLIGYRLHANNTIGLPRGRRSFWQVDAKGRMRVQENAEDALRFARDALKLRDMAPLPARYGEYMQTRRAVLENRDAKALIRLYTRYSDIYGALFSFKQRMGDILQLLRRPSPRTEP